MGEVTGQIRDIAMAHKRKKRFVLAAIALSLLIAGAALVWSRLRLPSAEERLAAIEAARTIPESENAATFYNRLMADVNAISFDLHPAFLDKISGNLTLRRPWSMLEHPELADWIEQRRGLQALQWRQE